MAGTDVALLAAGERAAAEVAWRTVEERLEAVPVVRGWPWVSAWVDHYGDVVPHRYAVVRRDGEPFAVAPICASRAGGRFDFGLRQLHVGTAGEPPGETVFVERNGLLAAPADLPAAARALVAQLLTEPGWDELRLDGLDEPDADAFAAADPRFRLAREPSPCTDLAAIRDDGGDVVAALAKGPRSRIRRSLRDLGQPSCEWAADRAAALATFDELVELHQARWAAAGEAGAFASARMRGFHRALIGELAETGGVALLRVATDTGTLACVYGLVDRGRFLFYQSGIAAIDLPRVKPGLVAHAICMQAALERGCSAYDFLAGDARYKRELATGEERLVWGRLERGGVRGRLVGALRRAAGRPRPITPFG